MMKTAVLSLALLAGVNAQTTPTTTQYVSQPLPTTTYPTTTYPTTTYPTTTYPTTTYPTTTYPTTTYPTTTYPTTQYYPQQQYQVAPTQVVRVGPPAGQQYPQYKRWAGKACQLIDLTLAPTAVGYKVNGVIAESDLNGDLSCDTSNKKAAAVALKLAGGEAEVVAAEVPSEAFFAIRENCALVGTKTTTDQENAIACYAKNFPTAAIVTKLTTFAALSKVKMTAACKLLSRKAGDVAVALRNAKSVETKLKVAICDAQKPKLPVLA